MQEDEDAMSTICKSDYVLDAPLFIQHNTRANLANKVQFDIEAHTPKLRHFIRMVFDRIDGVRTKSAINRQFPRKYDSALLICKECKKATPPVFTYVKTLRLIILIGFTIGNTTGMHIARFATIKCSFTAPHVK